MKKFITDACKKKAFGFSSNIEKNTDGISVGSPI